MIQQIYPYLFQWAGARNRAILLVNLILEYRQQLTDEHQLRILNLLLLENGYTHGTLEHVDPIENYGTEAGTSIILKSISNVQGVNALCNGGEIEFGNNLTIIYGQNGSGKSGYFRILKSIAPYTHDGDKSVLHNVVSGDELVGKSCQISYEEDGRGQTLMRTNVPENILSLAVFNTSCVSFSLGGDRTLLAQPEGFTLFDLIGAELDKLSSLVETMKQQINLNDPLVAGLHESTSVQIFHESITKDTTEVQLISFLGDKSMENIEQEIAQTLIELEKLNSDLILQKIVLCSEQISDLKKVLEDIEYNQSILTEEKRQDYQAKKLNLEELKQKESIGISDIGKALGAELTESPEFKDLINAADRYINILSREYPLQGEKCIYCLQELSQSSIELLDQYKKKLEEARSAGSIMLQTDIRNYETSLNTLKDNFILPHGPFGKERITQVEEVIVIPTILQDVFGVFKDFKLGGNIPRKAIDFDGLRMLLAGKQDEITEQRGKLESEMLIIDDKKEYLKHKLYELEDRKLYLTKKDIILTYISNLKNISRLEAIESSNLSRHSLSQKKKLAKDNIITDNYNTVYSEESGKLNCPTYINYSLGITEGQTSLRQQIGGHRLESILSEGEQKSIALAQFITEVKVANLKVPIVFDDPVTSLDHERQKRIAKRMVDLSREYQVIIFTHNIFLFYEIEQIVEELRRMRPLVELDYKYYTINRSNNQPGNINPDTRPSQEKFTDYRSELNQLRNNTPVGTSDEDIIRRGYAKLREMIEILIEDHILCGTIKRYKSHLPVGNFARIDIAKIDAHRENMMEVFSRCCSFFEGHSHPDGTRIVPTTQELRSDYDIILNIYGEFKV